MAIIGSVLSIYRRKIDDLEKAHADMRVDYIPRDELERHLDAMQKAREAMHADNTRKLERIEDQLVRLYDRIDKTVFRPSSNRTRTGD